MNGKSLFWLSSRPISIFSTLLIILLTGCETSTDGELEDSGLFEEIVIAENDGDAQEEPDVPYVTDEFFDVVEFLTEEMDFLFVIDNSGSMGDEQATLTGHLEPFVQLIEDSGLDFHIGVTSTDMESDKGLLVIDPYNAPSRYLDSLTQDPYTSFSEMASLGTSGSSHEYGFEATFFALEPNLEGYPTLNGFLTESKHGPFPTEENKGFLRKGAGLQVIIISDEDNAGGYWDGTLYFDNAETFVDWLYSLKSSSEWENIHLAAVADYDTFYEEAVELVDQSFPGNGHFANIATTSWTSILQHVFAANIGEVQTVFELSETPVIETIEVRGDPEPGENVIPESRYEYDSSIGDHGAIVFSETNRPVEFPEVYISYIPRGQ